MVRILTDDNKLSGDTDVVLIAGGGTTQSESGGKVSVTVPGSSVAQLAPLAQPGQSPPQEPVAPGAVANVGSLAIAARADHVHATSVSSPGILTLLYGFNTDVAAVLNGTNTVSWASKSGNIYTLNRHVHLAALTVSVGCTLRTNGFDCYVRGLLENDGIINYDGDAASGATQGYLAGFGTLPGGPGFGAAGGTGAGAAGLQPVQAGQYAGPIRGYGGAGGAGGAGGSGAGGAGGAALTTPDGFGSNFLTPLVSLGCAPFDPGLAAGGTPLYPWLIGGSGGGSGSGDGTNAGGGGGQGGGVLRLNCATLAGAGVISANGGKGGDATAGNAGGGAGGGAGLVIVNTSDASGWTGTLSAVGGAGGAKHGTGVAGATGGGSNSTHGGTYLNIWA